MGLDPTFPDYAGGAACHLCEDVIFDGKTPFYVEAWIFSIIGCPGVPPFPNDTVILLEQVDPCLWIAINLGWTLEWRLQVGSSTFFIHVGPTFVFSGQSNDNCVDTFDNFFVGCSPPFVLGHHGWVTLFWGPGIGP